MNKNIEKIKKEFASIWEMYQDVKTSSIPIGSFFDSIEKIEKKYLLDYRTIIGLSELACYENIDDDIFLMLLNSTFYNFKNVVSLAQIGLSNLVPYSYYENSEFLIKTNTKTLPVNFLRFNNKIEKFNICPEIERIGAYAFDNCKNLQIIDFEHTHINKIGRCAFRGCKNIKGILEFPISLNTIEAHAFEGCLNIEGILLNNINTIVSIEDYAFKDCLTLSFVDATNVHIFVKDYVFNNCVALTEFEGILSYIGTSAFDKCINLKEVKLASKYIGENAFYMCKNIKNITFYTLPDVFLPNSFAGCFDIENITNNSIYPFELYATNGFNKAFCKSIVKEKIKSNGFINNVLQTTFANS